MKETTLKAIKKEILSSTYLIISLIASHISTVSHILDDTDLEDLSIYLNYTADKIKTINN